MAVARIVADKTFLHLKPVAPVIRRSVSDSDVSVTTSVMSFESSAKSSDMDCSSTIGSDADASDFSGVRWSAVDLDEDFGDENVRAVTSLMIRDIPNKLTPDTFIEMLLANYKGQYDFVFLPMDKKRNRNLGYGFVNFVSAEVAQDFANTFAGVRVLETSQKILRVLPSHLQGLDENVQHFHRELSRKGRFAPMVFQDGERVPAAKLA